MQQSATPSSLAVGCGRQHVDDVWVARCTAGPIHTGGPTFVFCDCLNNATGMQDAGVAFSTIAACFPRFGTGVPHIYGCCHARPFPDAHTAWPHSAHV